MIENACDIHACMDLDNIPTTKQTDPHTPNNKVQKQPTLTPKPSQLNTTRIQTVFLTTTILKFYKLTW
jgi:hypothetical protein